MAKKLIAGTWCLFLLFLCACHGAPAAGSAPRPASASSAQSAPLPAVPELASHVHFDIAPLPAYDYDTWPALPLEYEIYAPGQGFLAALASLSDAQRIATWDSSHYLEIGPYTLFSATDPHTGLSCLMLDAPDGPPQILFETAQIITKVSASARGTLILQLLYQPAPLGARSRYCALDFNAQTLTPLDFPDNDSAYGYYCSLYCEQYFIAAITDETGDDTSLTIFSVSAFGSRTPLVDSVYAHTFMGGRIYYLQDDQIHLYSMDLDGTAKALVHTFEAPIHINMMGGFEAFGKYPFRVSSDGHDTGDCVLDVHTGEVAETPANPLYLSQDGFYTRDDAESILYYTPYGGAPQPLLANFKAEYGRVAVIGSWVYFTAQVFGYTIEEPAALQWKIKQDGSALTLLAPASS